MITYQNELKILQFTDIHLGEMPFNEEDKKTLVKLESTIIHEKPDLICITGDLIWSEGVNNPEQSFMELVALLNNHPYPVAVTYGNHDSEEGITRLTLRELEKEIKHLVQKNNIFVDSRDREAYTIELVKSKEVTNVLYFFDTGSMSPLDDESYDFVSAEQIEWYEKTFKSYQSKQKMTTDICLLHIPLPEFKDAAERIHDGFFWEQNPRIASPKLNTGLFSRFVFNKHVKYIFCGHDHDNNFLGEYLGIFCVYGNVSGYNCYGDLPRGYRLITLDGEKIQTEIRQYS